MSNVPTHTEVNVPTPWRTIFEKPVVAQRFKKYPVFIEPEGVLLCSKGAASCPVVLASWIQPKSSNSVSLRGILFTFFHLRLKLQEYFKSKILSALLSSCLSPTCFAFLVCNDLKRRNNSTEYSSLYKALCLCVSYYICIQTKNENNVDFNYACKQTDIYLW